MVYWLLLNLHTHLPPLLPATIDVLLTMEKQQQLLIKTRVEEKNMNELLVTLLVTGCLYSGTLETYHYI